MKNTVVIFNAGIGALTLGFQNAGYEILKAYEPDRKVIEIYQENISQNVTACSLSSIDPATVPDSDVWAFDLTQSKAEEVFYSLTLVQRRRPPAILFVMKKQLWKGFIKEHIFQLQEYGYHITHKNIQSSEVTAFPLREEFAYIVSKRVNASDMIMPVQVHKSSILLDGWVEMNPQDSWYSVIPGIHRIPGITELILRKRRLMLRMPVTAFYVGKKAVIGNPGRFV